MSGNTGRYFTTGTRTESLPASNDNQRPVNRQVFVILSLVLLVSTITMTVLYISKSKKAFELSRMKDNIAAVSQATKDVHDSLATNLRKDLTDKDMILSAMLEFGTTTYTDNLESKEFSALVHVSWDVITEMTKAIRHGNASQITDNLIAQVVGNVELSSRLVDCKGLSDITEVPRQSKLVMEFKLITDNIYNGKYLMIAAFVDKEFLNIVTQLINGAQDGNSIFGISIEHKLEQFLVRSLFLSPLFLRIGSIQNNVFKDSNDAVQTKNIQNMLGVLFLNQDKSSKVSVFVRSKPDCCPDCTV